MVFKKIGWKINPGMEEDESVTTSLWDCGVETPNTRTFSEDSLGPPSLQREQTVPA